MTTDDNGQMSSGELRHRIAAGNDGRGAEGLRRWADEDDEDDDELVNDGYTVRMKKSDYDALMNKVNLANRAHRLEREVAFRRAFVKAGLDIDRADPKEQKRWEYFIKGYDGELSVGSILSAAAKAGLMEVQDDVQLTNDELQALRRFRDYG